MIAAQTEAFIHDFGGRARLGEIGVSLCNDLAVLTLLTNRIAERLMRGERVSTRVHARLLTKKTTVARALKELGSPDIGTGARAAANITRVELESARDSLWITSIAAETGQNFGDVLAAWHAAREQGVSLATFLASFRGLAAAKAAFDSRMVLALPAPAQDDDESVVTTH